VGLFLVLLPQRAVWSNTRYLYKNEINLMSDYPIQHKLILSNHVKIIPVDKSPFFQRILFNNKGALWRESVCENKCGSLITI